MSFQWTVIATFLYVELASVLVLLLPWISACRWSKIFNSNLIKSWGQYANYYFNILMVLLGLCFLDSMREMRKYSHDHADDASATVAPGAVDHIHMKLFRAQRNFYIAGFALFLWFVLRRLVVLIRTEASLSASKDAAMKQAESASAVAKKLMEQQAKDETDDKSEKLLHELNEAKEELRSQQADMIALKKQAESTNREYDRLTEEYQKLQKQCEAAEAGGDKKSD